ncbi:uncharacterized protein C8Q71DRAFT_124633 [Rhodofomes roseus]|uniref:Secreted protein n=1 Tax=Rhodofomes roseus TaxID=34475 RepID=A0ABQ8KB49_9APHY|nr:uncharacterized protein C8Q71DRAFT_124633 [Rhodofomes roseus]KAH9834787.1 hypothetical protein C8Q71DRAFT_124633 [Rhodofomes roseus]
MNATPFDRCCLLFAFLAIPVLVCLVSSSSSNLTPHATCVYIILFVLSCALTPPQEEEWRPFSHRSIAHARLDLTATMYSQSSIVQKCTSERLTWNVRVERPYVRTVRTGAPRPPPLPLSARQLSAGLAGVRMRAAP